MAPFQIPLRCYILDFVQRKAFFPIHAHIYIYILTSCHIIEAYCGHLGVAVPFPPSGAIKQGALLPGTVIGECPPEWCGLRSAANGASTWWPCLSPRPLRTRGPWRTWGPWRGCGGGLGRLGKVPVGGCYSSVIAQTLAEHPGLQIVPSVGGTHGSPGVVVKGHHSAKARVSMLIVKAVLYKGKRIFHYYLSVHLFTIETTFRGVWSSRCSTRYDWN